VTGKEQPGEWLLKAFARGGVDTQELSRRLPGPVDLASRTPDTTTPDMVNAILLECASLSGDANFGLRMVELVDTADLKIRVSMVRWTRIGFRALPREWRGA
jgi:hypothetical protein